MTARPEGFEIVLHRSLTEPILLAGSPRTFAIVNGTVAAAVGLGLQIWWAGLAILIAGHTFAVFAAKRDPQFFDVVLRHVRQKGQFEC